jgi:hypothetical protein
MYRFLRRYRDRLARDINNGTLMEAGEFAAVCDLLNAIKPAFHRETGSPPPGIAERRRPH